MARKSPPLVNQKCDTGCTSRVFGIFNSKHSNKHTSGNGKSRISSGVLSTVDEKYPHIDVSSRRRRGYICKSICVENNQITDFENEATKMIVNHRFCNKNYQGKDPNSQPNQFLDTVQILYSNNELFVKHLQDRNSLLVKQFHELHNSQVKAEQNGMTTLNKAQNKSSFDSSNSSSNCESRSSKRIVVLKPGTNNVKKFADTSNDQNIKPSHSPLDGIKSKLKHVMRVRRKEQQCRISDSVTSKLPCDSHDLKDGKNVKELDIAETNSSVNVNASSGKNLKALKLKGHELISSKDIIREVLQAFSMKSDEPMKTHLLNILMDSSFTFDEIKGLTEKLSESKILHDYIIEVFMELYKNNDFSSTNSRLQACVVKKVLVREINELVNMHFFSHSLPIMLEKVVEKDLVRGGSWMNIQVDTEDIALELEEDVLEKLLLEIVFEMDMIVI